MNDIEQIAWGGTPLAYLIRAAASSKKTEFVTSPEANLQVGFVVYPAHGTIAPHVHRPAERRIVGTAEVLIVKKGRCLVDIYTDEKVLVRTCELRMGDTLLVLNGGHGFRMLEDTVLMEVKQGPYLGLDEKDRF